MALNYEELSSDPEFAVDRSLLSGKPLDVPLSDIAENPDNPRKEFDNKHLTNLAADIKQNNVKSPVSIRKNPTGETLWILNFGACRYKASQLAGKETIPAFVDEQFTEYDAVAENEIRNDLTPMELALFIQKRRNEGEQNKDIANRLQKDKQSITHHLALLEMPDCIADVYRSGVLRSARGIYDLVKLNKNHEQEVTKFCRNSAEISYSDVRKLVASLKRPESQRELPLEAPNPPIPANASNTSESGHKTTRDVESAVATFAEIPVMHINVEGKRAVIVLERTPTTRGMVWVKYLNNNTTVEVSARDCKLIELISGEQTSNPKKEPA